MVHEAAPRHFFFRDAHESAHLLLGGGLDQPRGHFQHLVDSAAAAVTAAAATRAAPALPVAALCRAAPPRFDETPLLRPGRIVLGSARRSGTRPDPRR